MTDEELKRIMDDASEERAYTVLRWVFGACVYGLWACCAFAATWGFIHRVAP